MLYECGLNLAPSSGGEGQEFAFYCRVYIVTWLEKFGPLLYNTSETQTLLHYTWSTCALDNLMALSAWRTHESGTVWTVSNGHFTFKFFIITYTSYLCFLPLHTSACCPLGLKRHILGYLSTYLRKNFSTFALRYVL